MPSAAHPLLAASLSGHDSFVEGVEFSSNGKYIMSSSSGKRFYSVSNKNTKLVVGYVIIFRARETRCNIVVLKARLLCVSKRWRLKLFLMG